MILFLQWRREHMYYSVKRTVNVPERYEKRKTAKTKFDLSKICISAIAVFLITIILCTGSILLHTSCTEAADNGTSQLYYKSVQIEQGDSLWSIAEEYMNPEFASIPDYIREIKRVNHISSDQIHAGAYLVVPYYASESY